MEWRRAPRRGRGGRASPLAPPLSPLSEVVSGLSRGATPRSRFWLAAFYSEMTTFRHSTDFDIKHTGRYPFPGSDQESPRCAHGRAPTLCSTCVYMILHPMRRVAPGFARFGLFRTEGPSGTPPTRAASAVSNRERARGGRGA